MIGSGCVIVLLRLGVKGIDIDGGFSVCGISLKKGYLPGTMMVSTILLEKGKI